jgi:hypothetical protein
MVCGWRLRAGVDEFVREDSLVRGTHVRIGRLQQAAGFLQEMPDPPVSSASAFSLAEISGPCSWRQVAGSGG